jgi:hypothetical protein
MTAILLIFTSLAGAFQVPEPCDEECRALMEATIRWVADFRDVSLQEIVVHVPSTEKNPANPAQLAALVGLSERIGFMLASPEQPVLCESPHVFKTPEEIPENWLQARCHLTMGKLLLRFISGYPRFEGETNAVVEVLHITYGLDGFGRIHRLHYRRTATGWEVDRAVLIAMT